MSCFFGWRPERPARATTSGLRLSSPDNFKAEAALGSMPPRKGNSYCSEFVATIQNASLQAQSGRAYSCVFEGVKR